MSFFRPLLFLLSISSLSATASWVYTPFPSGSASKGTAMEYKHKKSVEKAEAVYLRTELGIQFILSLFFAPIPFQREVDLKYKLGNAREKTVKGTLLKGGHKVILPANVSFDIARALSLRENVTFTIHSFSTVVTPDGFSEAWTRFRTFQ